MRALTFLCLLFITRPSLAAERIHRIAVFDFENLTNDPGLNWVGVALADATKVAIGHTREFTSVERKLLDRILKEREFNRSQLVDPKTVPAKKALSAADSILRGTFQKAGNDMRVTAEVVDVDSGEVRATVSVTGTVLGLVKLENDLVARLMVELKGTLVQMPVPITNVEALHAFSDGVYFYRNNFPKDALPLFDQALKLEPNYADAHYYKGMALEELQRWDDAIAEFKLALPRAAVDRRVLWNWEAPFTADTSKRGVLVGANLAELSVQGMVWSPDAKTRLINHFVYGERSGKNTILYFVDFEQRAVRRVELPDDKINLNDVTITTDRLALPMSIDNTNRQLPNSMNMYAIGLNTGSLWWNHTLSNLRGQIPAVGVASKSLYLYFRSAGRLVVFDDQNQTLSFPPRDGLELELIEPLKSRVTKTHGEILIVKTPDAIQAIRLIDGKDVWIVRPGVPKFTHIVGDDSVVIFDPSHRVLVIDMETGKTRQDIPVPQYDDDLPLGVAGSLRVVGARIDRNTLYFESKSEDLYAVKLDGGILWHTPVKQQIMTLNISNGRVYAGTGDGEIIALDAVSGSVVSRQKIASGKLNIEYSGPDVVVAWSDKTVYGLEPDTGKKRWEIAAPIKQKAVTVIRGVVVTRTSETDLSAIDAKSGAILWQYSTKQYRAMLNVKDALFILDENSVRELAVTTAEDRPSSTDREVLTELGHAYAAKGSFAEAESIADKVARDIGLDYAPLRDLRVSIEKAKGNSQAVARELAAYASLAGTESRDGQRALAELKKDHELIWRQPLDVDPVGKPAMAGEMLISIGNSTGSGKGIIALNISDGTSRWRQVTEGFSDSVIDDATGRAWMVTRDATDGAVLVLYALSLDLGTRKELARWQRSSPAGYVSIAYANDRVYVAGVALDLPTTSAAIDIRAFTPSGTGLWTTSEKGPLPFSFLAKDDRLILSIGKELRIFNGATGSVVNQHHEEDVIGYRIVIGDASSLYYVTGKQQIVRYDMATGTVTSRSTLPAFDVRNFSFFVRDNTLITTDTHFIFAFDLAKSKETWRVTASKDQQILGLIPSDKKLIALRDDQTLLHIDPLTGKILTEQTVLWRPASWNVIADKVYVFTTDRAAFAMHLKP